MQARDLQDCVFCICRRLSALVWNATSPVPRDKATSCYQNSSLPCCSSEGSLFKPWGQKRFGFTLSLSLPTLECSFYQLCQTFIFQMESSSGSFSQIHWIRRRRGMHPVLWILWRYRWAIPFRSPHQASQTQTLQCIEQWVHFGGLYR